MTYPQNLPEKPEGWKLVPIEPTPGMIDAAEYVDWGDADMRGSCINAWHRMLAAAPCAQPAPSVPEGASGEVFEHWNVVRSTQSAPNPSRMLIEDSIKEARISDIPFDFQMVGLEVPWRFAAIIAKHERDACYEIAQSQLGNTNALMSNPPKSAAAWEIARRIRARNNL